jgi:adenosylhomocysteine nucleosidase
MKVGIIGAMDEEVAIIREKISSVKEIDFGICTFYEGKIEGIDVLLLKSGIGKVNASIGTTLLILYAHPNCIINTGSAGGFSNDLNIGDVVISNEVRHHDVDVTAFGYEYGQVPKMPSRYLPNSSLVEIAQKSVTRVEGIRFTNGLIATGDSFMNNPEHINELKDRMPGIMVAEMEAAAIAQTCYHFNKNFVIIRSVSDIAGKESPHTFESFLKTAAKNSAAIVLEMLKEIKAYEIENERRTPESIQKRLIRDMNHEKNIRFYYRPQ